jgi:hypothetical protein
MMADHPVIAPAPSASLMAGASAADIIGRYREPVAANARRLAAI